MKLRVKSLASPDQPKPDWKPMVFSRSKQGSPDIWPVISEPGSGFAVPIWNHIVSRYHSAAQEIPKSLKLPRANLGKNPKWGTITFSLEEKLQTKDWQVTEQAIEKRKKTEREILSSTSRIQKAKQDVQLEQQKQENNQVDLSKVRKQIIRFVISFVFTEIEKTALGGLHITVWHLV